MPVVTLTVRRKEQDITVELRTLNCPTRVNIVQSIDEQGIPVILTEKEEIDVILRALAGEDETGV